MKVYVLCFVNYDATHNIGVYANEQTADEECARLNAKQKQDDIEQVAAMRADLESRGIDASHIRTMPDDWAGYHEVEEWDLL